MRLFPLRALGAAILAVALHTVPLTAQQRDSARTVPRTARDSVRADSVRADSVRADSVRADSVRADSVSRRRTPRARRPAPTSSVPDSLLRPPISPRRAFLYSLVVPGQGQTRLRRPRAAALFGSIEVGSIFMLLKSENDLRIARNHRADSVFVSLGPPAAGSTDSTRLFRPDPLALRIRSRRLHVEDWIAVLVFNHLFAGADAFVAAQLWDVPAQVSFQPVPRGLAVSASVAW